MVLVLVYVMVVCQSLGIAERPATSD